jgi:hypothetical protein
MSIETDSSGGGSYGNVNDAIVCYKFLNALGTYQCTVPPGQRSTVLAYSGTFRVVGYGIGASSYWYVRFTLGDFEYFIHWLTTW